VSDILDTILAKIPAADEGAQSASTGTEEKKKPSLEYSPSFQDTYGAKDGTKA
jgi:hypothetical protein